MKLVWHIVKKDLRRLRLPVLLWLLLMAGEIIYYVAISGLVGAPNLDALNRMQMPAETLLRVLVEPMVAYLLIGWLVFDDGLVSTDPFWVTRPIAGGQLLAAKLVGATLMFVVAPILINIPWWVACGFGVSQMLVAAGQMVLLYGALIVLGTTVAALTDGFPRYIMWTVVGTITFYLIVMIIAAVLEATGYVDLNNGNLISRMMVWGLSAGVLAAIVVSYQFTTRRHQRALTFLAVGALGTSVACGVWPWDLTDWWDARTQRAAARMSEQVQVKLVAPSSYVGRSIRMYLGVEGAPSNLTATGIRAQGDWNVNGTLVWSGKGNTNGLSMTHQAVRNILGLSTAPAPVIAEPRGIQLTMPMSPVVAKRLEKEPASFRGRVQLNIFQGRPVAELPLREHAVRGEGRSFSVSKVEVVPISERRQRGYAAMGLVHGGRAIAVELTERSDFGPLFGAWSAMMRQRRPFEYYALVRRGTGEIVTQADAGRYGFALLNGVFVYSTRLEFPLVAPEAWLRDAVLAVVQFEEGHTITRTLEVDPFILGSPPARAGN